MCILAALALVACNAPQSSRQVTEVKMTDQIVLLEVPRTGGLTTDEALWQRCSSREYAAADLSLEELSGVVWAAAGINRPDNDHLTAPSALALYPIRTYAFLSGGVYAYDAKAHTLTRVLEGDRRAVSGAQPFVATAPLNLVFIADLNAYEGRNIPLEHARFLCGQDAAGYAENANLYAAGHGLKSVTRGSASPALLSTLGLDPERYFFALAVSVGK